MSKNLAILILFVIVAAVSGSKGQAITSATPAAISSTGVLANCPVVAPGASQWCFTTTGEYQSLNGSPWALITAGPTPAPITLTLQGVTKTLPASFTFSSTTSATTNPVTVN